MDGPAKWFTCTPVRFAGDETFFSRDSGLLSKGFQAVGMPCQAIMPGPPLDGDCREDLVRTSYENLKDPSWWKSLGGRGVVLYAWGAARYYPVARAIRRAGMQLVCNMDTSGNFGILGGPLDYWAAQWRILNGLGTNPLSIARFALKIISSFSWSLLKHDIGRARHLQEANVIGAICPIAVERIRRVCRWYGGPALASRVHLLPHPVSPYMNYSHQEKKPRVIAVGRWLPKDWQQKNPFLLMEVIRLVLDRQPDVEVAVVGAMEEPLRARFLQKAGHAQGRLHLTGRVPNRDLPGLLQGSQVALCTSNHESFHIASAEALCCGCSVVGPDLPELPSLVWFTSVNSGRLARRTPEALARAVLDELDLWKKSVRNPNHISDYWTQRLHADRVAAQILRSLGCPPATGGPNRHSKSPAFS